MTKLISKLSLIFLLSLISLILGTIAMYENLTSKMRSIYSIRKDITELVDQIKLEGVELENGSLRAMVNPEIEIDSELAAIALANSRVTESIEKLKMLSIDPGHLSFLHISILKEVSELLKSSTQIAYTMATDLEGISSIIKGIINSSTNVKKAKAEKLELNTEVSKLIREGFSLEKVDKRAYNDLVRAAFVLSFESRLKNINFVGKAKFNSAKESFDSSDLDPELKTKWLEISKAMEALGELSFLANNSSGDYNLLSTAIKNLKTQNDQVISNMSSIDTIFSKYLIEINTYMWVIISIFVTMFLLVLAAYVLISYKKTSAEIQLSTSDLEASTSTLRKMSQDVQDLNKTLSVSVTESSAGLQESTTTLSRTASLVNQTSQATMKASGLFSEIVGQSDNGLSLITSLTESTGNLLKTSENLEKIARIVDTISEKSRVINEVVFKTQLLSVNASIEAARAGQYGKGFAVVASEVSNLAQLTGKASNEISLLLNHSKQAVNDIVESTKQAIGKCDYVGMQCQKVFHETSKSLSHVEVEVRSINDKARDQAVSINQVLAALEEISRSSSSLSQAALNIEANANDLNTEVERLNRIKVGVKKSLLG